MLPDGYKPLEFVKELAKSFGIAIGILFVILSMVVGIAWCLDHYARITVLTLILLLTTGIVYSVRNQ